MPASSRDPYDVLGVTPAASDAELHGAYRRLVQLHHPDHNQGSPDSSRRFEEIQEAYARAVRLRSSARPASHTPPEAAVDPNLEARLAGLERELREAHAARDRARRAAAEEVRQAARESAAPERERPSDEELGYIKTDDSFAKILADARSEFSGQLDEARQHPVGKRVADLIDELALKLTGD